MLLNKRRVILRDLRDSIETISEKLSLRFESNAKDSIIYGLHL